MKKLIALIISSTMLISGCTNISKNEDYFSEENHEVTEISKETHDVTTDTVTEFVTTDSKADSESIVNEENLRFLTMDDPDLLRFSEDSIYAELVNQLNSDDYIIEDVHAIYMPEEYFAEVEFNSQENIYFGFKTSELDKIFEGTKYVFTLDENGQTTVQEMNVIAEDTLNDVINNVALGCGVIVVCVTVSVVTGAIGAPAVSLVFAAAAETAKTFALSSAVIGGVSAAFIKGVETRNLEETIKSAALGASEGFKWGAVTGAVAGGASEGFKLARSAKEISNAILNGESPAIGAAAEKYVQEFYKGAEAQVSFLGGEEVSMGTAGATRPDWIYRNANGTVKAIEVKNYNLKENLSGLKTELIRQVRARVDNLPAGSTQEIALVTKGRGYTKSFTDDVIKQLQDCLFDIYGGEIPIKVY